MGNEYSYFTGKVFNSLLCGIFFGVMIKKARNYAIRNKKNLNQSHKKFFRLILRNPELLNRDYIVQLGRQSIRCGLSGMLLVDPLVGPDGVSYEKNLIEGYVEKYGRLPNGKIINSQENNFEGVLYKNRTLKELIEKLKTFRF
jgi:hypothetical protein